jgi:indole-3-glycerol phosphate synthase
MDGDNMNILDEIAGKTRERIAQEKRVTPLEVVRREAERVQRENAQNDFAFARALAADGMSFICEVKKASPSKGLIAPEFPYLDIARAYEEAGASAISCLTEPFYFQGQDAYLKEIVETVQIPVLRKDFTVDEYMIYQAKALGAGAVLLICAILDDAQLLAYGQLAQELGLSALVEAHLEEEVERALKSGAKIVGVNNRDLKTFQVDITTSARLRRMVPPEILFVSESGIRGTEDIRALRQNGTDAVLIGETLMRAADKRALLAEWKQI